MSAHQGPSVCKGGGKARSRLLGNAILARNGRLQQVAVDAKSLEERIRVISSLNVTTELAWK